VRDPFLLDGRSGHLVGSPEEAEVEPDLVQLTPGEREHCRDRAARRGARVPVYAPLTADPGEARALQKAGRCNELLYTYRTVVPAPYPGGHRGGPCG
jgi:hypothetical protein